MKVLYNLYDRSISLYITIDQNISIKRRKMSLHLHKTAVILDISILQKTNIF
jgi:hypothetical protein